MSQTITVKKKKNKRLSQKALDIIKSLDTDGQTASSKIKELYNELTTNCRFAPNSAKKEILEQVSWISKSTIYDALPGESKGPTGRPKKKEDEEINKDVEKEGVDENSFQRPKLGEPNEQNQAQTVTPSVDGLAPVINDLQQSNVAKLDKIQKKLNAKEEELAGKEEELNAALTAIERLKEEKPKIVEVIKEVKVEVEKEPRRKIKTTNDGIDYDGIIFVDQDKMKRLLGALQKMNVGDLKSFYILHKDDEIVAFRKSI